MRRFYFDRQTDVSGTSGTGAVVEGVQFSDGQVVVRWLTFLSSVSIYESIEDAIAIHGHNGSTDLHWVDDEASTPPTETERPPGWTSSASDVTVGCERGPTGLRCLTHDTYFSASEPVCELAWSKSEGDAPVVV